MTGGEDECDEKGEEEVVTAGGSKTGGISDPARAPSRALLERPLLLQEQHFSHAIAPAQRNVFAAYPGLLCRRYIDSVRLSHMRYATAHI
jgi:hypothetical protein